MDRFDPDSSFAADSLGFALGTFAAPEGPSLVQVIGALCLVLAIIVGAFALYRRFGGVAAGGARGGEIKIVGRTQVGRRNAIVLVEVDGRRVLVGATPDHLSALSEWEEPGEAPEAAPEEVREVLQAAPSRFDSVLSRVLSKLRAIEESSS